MFRLIDRLVPAALANADPETRRRTQLVARCSVIMMLIFPVMSVIYGVRGHAHLGLSILGVWLLQPLTLIVLWTTKKLAWGAHTLCFLLWATFGVLAALTGGTHAPILASNGLLILLATMLDGQRGGITWAGIVLVTIVSTLARTELGLGVSQVLDEAALLEFRTAEPLATGSVTLAMCIIYERVKDQMLRAVETERARAAQAHADTKVILDNTGQGFVTLDRQGWVIGETSATAQRWLPALRVGEAFSQALAERDTALGEAFVLAWEQLVEGFLPLELTLDQMPTRLLAGAKTFKFEYRALTDAEGSLERVVVIITDITAALAQEQTEADQKELLSVFRRVIGDRDGVAEFVEESDSLVNKLRSGSGNTAEVKRWLHTLKGNSGLMGLQRFSRLCHALEDQLENAGGRIDKVARQNQEQDWNHFADRIRPFLGEQYHGDIVLDAEDYQGFQQRLMRGTSHEALAREVQLWALEPLDTRLRRFGERAAALCTRLGKAKPLVLVEAIGVRVATQPLTSFWSAFVHVIRNAVDHGFEAEDARRQAGKPEQPRLALKAYLDQGDLVIEVADDGAGIDWRRVAARARECGMPYHDHDRLVAVLFTDGVSSRDEVTDVSGRGVGLGAVKQACDDLGGSIAVESREGQGTRFYFRLPGNRVHAGILTAHAA